MTAFRSIRRHGPGPAFRIACGRFACGRSTCGRFTCSQEPGHADSVPVVHAPARPFLLWRGEDDHVFRTSDRRSQAWIGTTFTRPSGGEAWGLPVGVTVHDVGSIAPRSTRAAEGSAGVDSIVGLPAADGSASIVGLTRAAAQVSAVELTRAAGPASPTSPAALATLPPPAVRSPRHPSEDRDRRHGTGVSTAEPAARKGHSGGDSHEGPRRDRGLNTQQQHPACPNKSVSS